MGEIINIGNLAPSLILIHLNHPMLGLDFDGMKANRKSGFASRKSTCCCFLGSTNSRHLQARQCTHQCNEPECPQNLAACQDWTPLKLDQNAQRKSKRRKPPGGGFIGTGIITNHQLNRESGLLSKHTVNCLPHICSMIVSNHANTDLQSLIAPNSIKIPIRVRLFLCRP